MFWHRTCVLGRGNNWRGTSVPVGSRATCLKYGEQTMSEGKLVKINHVRTMKAKDRNSSQTSLSGWLFESHTIFILFMVGLHVSGYQQKAGEGARDKTKHEADSLRAIRRYSTFHGKAFLWGTGAWSFGLAFIRNWSYAENWMPLLIMKIFIINTLETWGLAVRKKAERNEFGEFPS